MYTIIYHAINDTITYILRISYLQLRTILVAVICLSSIVIIQSGRQLSVAAICIDKIPQSSKQDNILSLACKCHHIKVTYALRQYYANLMSYVHCKSFRRWALDYTHLNLMYIHMITHTIEFLGRRFIHCENMCFVKKTN